MKPLRITAILMIATLSAPRCIIAGENPSPQPGQMLDYAFTAFCIELSGQIHQSKDNPQVRQGLVRDYYRVVFCIWFGTRYIPIPEAKPIDPRGYIRTFQIFSKRDHFSDLVDYDDPLGWNRFPPNYSQQDKQKSIDLFRGDEEYLTWILEQTKDPAAYKKAVREFRAFTESAMHDPDFPTQE